MKLRRWNCHAQHEYISKLCTQRRRRCDAVLHVDNRSPLLPSSAGRRGRLCAAPSRGPLHHRCSRPRVPQTDTVGRGVSAAYVPAPPRSLSRCWREAALCRAAPSVWCVPPKCAFDSAAAYILVCSCRRTVVRCNLAATYRGRFCAPYPRRYVQTPLRAVKISHSPPRRDRYQPRCPPRPPGSAVGTIPATPTHNRKLGVPRPGPLMRHCRCLNQKAMLQIRVLFSRRMKLYIGEINHFDEIVSCALRCFSLGTIVSFGLFFCLTRATPALLV